MAIVSITPLSIAGVQVPTNLLASLFADTSDNKNLLYPIDLATNPQYAHAVQFTIFDYSTTVGDEVNQIFNSFGGSIGGASFASTVNGVKSFFSNINESITGLATAVNSPAGLTGQTISNVFPSEVPTKIASFFQAQSYKPVTKTAPLATISLYMPDTVNTQFDSLYSQISMTETLGVGGYLGNAYSDFKGKGSLKDNAANIINSPYGKNFAFNLVGKILGNENISGALSTAAKQVPNPQMQLIYKGIELRSFQLEFIFTPVSAQEAQVVNNIINAFTYYSVPGYVQTGQNGTNSGQFLTPPQIFNIKFSFTGQPGVLGSIQNVLTNTLTNVIGSQLTNNLMGAGASEKIKAAGINAKVFQVGDCVLTNVVVDYAPNGWAAYGDGYPVQTTMILQFQEMDIVTKDKITKWTGFSDSSVAGSYVGPAPGSADISGYSRDFDTTEE